MPDVADRFMQALGDLEQSRRPDALLGLFTDDVTLTKPAAGETEKGREGARRYWEKYLDAFREVKSTFLRVVRTADTVVLEWTSEGALPDGKPIRYDGVSILDVRGDQVAGFRTYYDSAAFLQPGAGR